MKKLLATIIAAALLTSVVTPAITASAAMTENETSAAVIDIEESGRFHPKWSEDGNYFYYVKNDGTAALGGRKTDMSSFSPEGGDETQSQKAWVVPEEVDGYKVTQLGDNNYMDRPFGMLSNGVVISKNINYIHPGFFQLAGKISVVPENEYYTVVDDILYSKDMKTLVKYMSENTEFDVPEGVEKIAANALAQSQNKTDFIPKREE